MSGVKKSTMLDGTPQVEALNHRIWGYASQTSYRQFVFVSGTTGMTPAEAREFAAAIVAVADAVEREGK